MKILVLNNYSFGEVWEEIKSGKKPANHLYGVDFLDKMGHEIILVPYKKSKFLVKLSDIFRKYLPIPLGDLDQQWSAIKMRKSCDVVYSPCQTQTWVLSYLRAVGLFNKPIVAVGHHPFQKGRLNFLRLPFFKWAFAGTDFYPALSNSVAQEINTISGKNKSIAIFWGPALNYFPFNDNEGDTILVAGRTGRDFLTFGRALTGLPHIKAKIICLTKDYKPEFKTFGKNIEIVSHDEPVDYKALFMEYSKARIIAIPYDNTKNLCGLTSLNDAMSLARPVVMTKSEYIDIDLEKEGIGFWAEANSVEDWKKILTENWENTELLKEMGKKSRSIAEVHSDGVYNETIHHIILQAGSNNH